MTHDPYCPDALPSDYCCDWVAEIRADERAAALRDAVQAVKALPPNGIGVAADAWLWESALGQEVIAAIEALGGER